jgi:anti-sigma-K factor RskA
MSIPPDDIAPETYADLAAIARQITLAESHLDEPPADLWARIESAIDDPSDNADVEDRSSGAAPTYAADPVAGPPVSGSGARDELSSRRRNLRWVLATAAAIVVVIGAVGVVVRERDNGRTTIVAQVALANADQNPALDAAGAASSGVAKLVTLPDGEYALDVDVSKLPATGTGFLELWMIDRSVHDMVSLGPLTHSGRVILPASIDPSRYPVVDISIEPNDGQPTHSGKSILRGILDV